jgi:hypothetical protein
VNIKSIVKAANKLDRLGRLEDADRLDGLLIKLAQDETWTPDLMVERWKTTLFSPAHYEVRSEYDFVGVNSPEDYERYLLSEEEIAWLLGEYKRAADTYEAIDTRLRNLYNEILEVVLERNNDDMNKEFEEKFLSISPYNKEKTIPDLANFFIKSLGPSKYKNNYVLKKDFHVHYATNKYSYIKKIKELEEEPNKILEKIPDSLDDFITKMGLSSREELSEALFYLYSGVTKSNLRTRLTKSPEYEADIIHPLKGVESLKLNLILMAGRTYIRKNIQRLKLDTSKYYYENYYDPEIKEEAETTYWPESEEEPASNESSYEKAFYDKEEYINDYIRNSLNLIEFLYRRTDKLILKSAFNYLDKKINEYFNRKFDNFIKVFKAYGFQDEEIEKMKKEYFNRIDKSGWYSGFAGSRGSNNIGEIYNTLRAYNTLNRDAYNSSTFSAHDEALFGHDKALFGLINYKQSYDFDMDYVLTEFFAPKIKEKIKAQESAYGEISLSDIKQALSDVDREIAADIDAGNGHKYFAAFNNFDNLREDDFNENIPMVSIDKKIYSKKSSEENPDAIKKLILGTRFSAEGTTGFRNFKKHISDLEYSDAFYPLEMLGLDAKRNLIEELVPKVLIKMYAEEEAFMTNRREEHFDESQRIAQSLGVKDLQKWLFKKFNGRISLPSLLAEKLVKGKRYQDEIDKGLISLLTSLSSEEEFNSIERMHKFLIEVIKVTGLRQDDERVSRLDELERYEPEVFASRLSGPKDEKIEKLLFAADLMHNNSFIKNEIAWSKYLDKFNYDIIRKIVEIYNMILSLKNQEKNKFDSLFRGSRGEFNEDIVTIVTRMRSAMKRTFGRIKTVKLIPEHVVEALEVFRGVTSLDEAIEALDIDFSQLTDDSEYYQNIKKLVASMSFTIDTLQSFEAVKKYYAIAKPKDQNLFKLDLTTPTFRFRTLKDYDPYHFRVGIDTDCCQRLGGAGWPAAVDSFINPLAGVVLLEVKTGGEWRLAAQSYFHWVPKDNGIILDNIEHVRNPRIRKRIKDITGYTFPEIYMVLGDHLKDQGIEEFLIGKEYTKIIDEEHFNRSKKKEDPRSFEVDEPYTDYNPRNSYNIFDANISLDNMPQILPNEVTANLLSLMIKIAAISSAQRGPAHQRLTKLARYLISDDMADEALKLDALLF